MWRFLTLVCCVVMALAADTSPDRNKVYSLRSAELTFRPQSHVMRIEKYRFMVEEKGEISPNQPDNIFATPQVLQKSTVVPDSVDEVYNIEANSTDLPSTRQRKIRSLFKFDDMDRLIVATTLPLTAVFAIIPIANALDLFWVNRLGEALAVAGQSAANQVYNTAFFLFAFLPSVTATLVSKNHASGDLEKTQDAVCQAMFFAVFLSLAGTILMFFNPEKALRTILKDGSPALATATPYLRIRAFSFIPMFISFVAFSAFRGTMNVKVSAKLALLTNLITAILDPLFIHVFGIGVRGAALATLAGEYTSAFFYVKLLIERNLIRWDKLVRIPKWSTVAPLIKGSIAFQIRSLALNLTQLIVARVIQSIDNTGVTAAAHALAIQVFFFGGIVFGALGMATQTIVPNVLSEKEAANPSEVYTGHDAEVLVRRLLKWAMTLGASIGLIQLMCLPVILSSSPLQEVREAARIPALIASSFQPINGIVSVGEGAMMGKGNFVWLAVNNIIAALGFVGTLQIFPRSFGLTGVWMSMAIFVLLRLAGVLANLFVTQEPETPAYASDQY